MGSKGGGSAGGVDFPTHMKDIHQDWLGYSSGVTAVNTDVVGLLNAAFATNPYESLTYDDPATNMAAAITEYNAFNTYVDGLAETTDYNTIINAIVSQLEVSGVVTAVDIDTIMTTVRTGSGTTVTDAISDALNAIDEGVLAQAVQQYVSVRRLDRAKLRSRYKAQGSNVSLERGSAYAIGMALLESEFEKETGQYQQSLSIEMYSKGLEVYLQAFKAELTVRVQSELAEKQSRDTMLINGIQTVFQYKQFIVEFKKQLATVLQDLHIRSFQADSEYVGNTGDINAKHGSWGFQAYEYATNVLGGIGGGSMIPASPSKLGSTISGALGGAVKGAQIGGPLGAGVGALVGGLAGFL